MKKLCVVTKLCVKDGGVGQGGGGSGGTEAGRRRDGIQNQKQEPHTKMRGKKRNEHSMITGTMNPQEKISSMD